VEFYPEALRLDFNFLDQLETYRVAAFRATWKDLTG
jgi:hypothetical protein